MPRAHVSKRFKGLATLDKVGGSVDNSFASSADPFARFAFGDVGPLANSGHANLQTGSKSEVPALAELVTSAATPQKSTRALPVAATDTPESNADCAVAVSPPQTPSITRPTTSCGSDLFARFAFGSEAAGASTFPEDVAVTSVASAADVPDVAMASNADIDEGTSACVHGLVSTYSGEHDNSCTDRFDAVLDQSQSHGVDHQEAAGTADVDDPFACFSFGSGLVGNEKAEAWSELGLSNRRKGRGRLTAEKTSAQKRERPEISSFVFEEHLARSPLDCSSSRDGLRFFLVDVTESFSAEEEIEVLMHGVTAGGQSVAARVKGFRPYFYCEFPVPEEKAWCEKVFCDALSALLQDASGTTVRSPVVAATRMQRRPLMYYQRDSREVLRVELTASRFLSAACRKVEHGFQVPAFDGVQGYHYQSSTWEGNVPFILRFMVDMGLVGGGWVELQAGVQASACDDRRTSAQVEVSIERCNVKALPPENELLSLAPLRLLSLNLRCDDAGRIVSIGSVLAQHGDVEPLARMGWLLTSQQCYTSDGVVIHCFADEAALLEHFGAFLAHCDPDILLGYELGERVLSRLLSRCQAVRASAWASQLGRVQGLTSKARRVGFQGSVEARTDVNADGRLLIDVARVVSQEHRLTSYALPAVAQHFLGGTHFELRSSDALQLLAEKPAGLVRQDIVEAEAVRNISERLCTIYNLVGMARVTGVPVSYLLNRGQMIKVTSQLLRKANEQGFMLPSRSAGGRDTFEGGFVMEPKTGLYEEPIVVLDFASLYPSIMMAHNLCYTTLLQEGAERGLGIGASSLTTSPAETESGVPYKFVASELRRGILPSILEELISERKATKQLMARTTDDRTKAVLNGRQLALKISANSVYGFTGASSGAFPCLEIASSVTAYGRNMITSTAAHIESQTPNARVVYGDTDSVMLSFGDVARSEAVSLGRQVAHLASSQFIAPIRLEFEKVLQPYLLLNKKRYVGRPWDGFDALDLDMKGIETVRRDWCGLVRQTCEHSLDLLMRPDRSVSAAVDYVQGVIADLRRGAVDLRLLVISKCLGKKGEADYVAKSAHVELAEKLRKRDPKSAPRAGDRVAFVVLSGSAGAKVYERAEDPKYAQVHDLPIDAEYYIEQQLKQPLLRIFEPIVGGDSAKVVSMLFAGAQVQKVTVPRGLGGLSAFIKRGEKCLVCRVALQTSAAFCKDCDGTDQAANAREAKLVEGRAIYARQCALRGTCQGCVSSTLGDDAHHRCNNVACEIFFERSQVAKSVEDARAVFQRLSLDW